MANDKKKRAQPSKKRKQQKVRERSSQRGDRPGQPNEPAPQEQHATRRRPGEGLDKSDEGVIAGSRLAGRRFTG